MTYLKKSYFLLACLICAIFFNLYGVHLFFFLALTLFLFLLFLSRKKRNLKIIEEKENGLIFSPVSGVIKSIEEINESTYIHIKRDFFNEWGVYMPSCGKIEEVQEISGRKHWFFFKSKNYKSSARTLVRVKSKLGKYDMHLIHSKFSDFDCWIDSGDYGFTAARLGFIKSSFNVVLVLPKDFSIVVTESEVLKSGKSIIAANTAVHS